MRVAGAPSRLVGLAAAAAAAVVALWHAPGELRNVWREARNASAESELERRLVPARVVGLDRLEIFLAARRLIPPDATYYVEPGERAPVSSPNALDWVRPFATYWLLPRRRTDELGEAQWILSYGGDLQALGLDYARVVGVDDGFALAEVRR